MRRVGLVLGAVVACVGFVAGCQHASPGEIVWPKSEGPLATNWLPAGSQLACFPHASASGRITDTGLLVKNSSMSPLTIVGIEAAPETVNFGIIAREMLPTVPQPTDVLGPTIDYPPASSLVHEYDLTTRVPAKGYVLASKSTAAIFVGLQMLDPHRDAHLPYLNVSYRVGNTIFHLFTPEQIKVSPSCDSLGPTDEAPIAK